MTDRMAARSYAYQVVRVLCALLCIVLFRFASASTAYGALSNFDCVNDTGVRAHGFDIEIDDLRSVNITYTYDYNHYGVPKISENLTDPLHPKVLVRYASTKNPDGTWAAYTAVPSSPIPPTMGHQFTDPSVNFGGEHFGVGVTAPPSAVKYNWLIDDGTGNLIQGPPVYISTPVFTYNPPAAGAPPNVVAVIVPPPPPAPPLLEFGEASWVKEIKTTTVNAGKVPLDELVADDPGQPQPWANGEAPEVEVEWQLLQTDFGAANGGVNGELQGAPEDLPGGNEVVTRRYEFHKYLGPRDAETGEAVADTVAADGIHGVGIVTYADHIDPFTGEWVTVTVDLSTVVVVGDFFGAQMAGFDAHPDLGLIDHIQDGELNAAYPNRTVVVQGPTPFSASVSSGALPDGLTLDPVTGVLSGTPTVAGAFSFTVDATDLGGAHVSKAYTVNITQSGAAVSFTIGTSSSPSAGGTTTGGGSFPSGQTVTVRAVANPTYYFVGWTDGAKLVSPSATYVFLATMNRSLVANFVQDTTPPVTTPSLSGKLGSHGWYVGPVTVSLSATDDLSGVAGTYYQVDGGGQLTYTGPFAVSGDGKHEVTYWSVDNVGNVEKARVREVDIDVSPPVLTALASPATLWPPNGAMIAVHISGRASDSISGLDLASCRFSTIDSYGLIQPAGLYKAEGGSYTLTVQLQATRRGNDLGGRTYYITVVAKDMAGNVGLATVTVTVPHDRGH